MDKDQAKKYVDEAPYHPGYEGAGFETVPNPLIDELNNYRKMNAMYLATAKVIVQFAREKYHE